jgi:hypothetical protein
MPYKDPLRKQEWERLNRPARLARRHELRRIAAARETAERVSPQPDHGGSLIWLVLAAGVGLAFYNPRLALGTGTLTLMVAALAKKGWQWWAIGVATLLLALLFLQKKEEVGT